jgi:hypothetical protein
MSGLDFVQRPAALAWAWSSWPGLRRERDSQITRHGLRDGCVPTFVAMGPTALGAPGRIVRVRRQ